MSAFESLLELSEKEKRIKGVEYTVSEIAQQPEVWNSAVSLLRARKDELKTFLEDSGLSGSGQAILLLAGAGSSEFVGNSVVNVLRNELKRDVHSIATTHFVTHPDVYFVPERDYVLLSFARSGDSPESISTYLKASAACDRLKHLVISCNPDGMLTKAAATNDNVFCLQMPPESNDKSLVMTSSFSTMVLSAFGLPLLDQLDYLEDIIRRVSAAAQRVMTECDDTLYTFAQRDFSRACFLGSNALHGTMQECHLKMQEMTDGRVASTFNSYLGFRHGPLVFANRECIIVAALATTPRVRAYEMDMLREVKTKGIGAGTLVICDRATDDIRELCDEIVELFPDGDPISDDFRVMSDVVVGQLLGTFTSMKLGLKPDRPSPGGIINRVVEGVRIY